MKVVQMTLTAQSIQKAIDATKEFKKWLEDKSKEFLKALGDEGVEIASAKFGEAIYDGTNDVSCHVEERDDTKVAVMAVGGATLFIEFGTGVRYPDDHPEAAKNGMVRGTYGYGLGKLKGGWRYEGDPGTNGQIITEGKHAGEVHTYGNPANMCMYLTVRELEDKFEEIARRVFV